MPAVRSWPRTPSASTASRAELRRPGLSAIRGASGLRPGRRVRYEESESAGKPSSVPPATGQSRPVGGRQSSFFVAGYPTSLATLPEDRPSQPYRPPIRSCSGWGLPSQPVSRLLVGSYPHHFTFAAAYATAVYFLWHSPSGHPDRALPGTLLCGARTFLDGTIPARLPGGLGRYCTRVLSGDNQPNKPGTCRDQRRRNQERQGQANLNQRPGYGGPDRLSGPIQAHRNREGPAEPGGIGPSLTHREHAHVKRPDREAGNQHRAEGHEGV